MAEVIPLALVNQALARVLPGAIAEAVEVRDRFVAHSADVVRLAISASPASTQPLPSTAIAKYCPGESVTTEGIPEIACYERLLQRASPSLAPRLFGAYSDVDAGVSLLLAEDLNADFQRPVAPVPNEVLESVVDAIARFHAEWWERDELDHPRFAELREKPPRMPQAHPPVIVQSNRAVIPSEID